MKPYILFQQTNQDQENEPDNDKTEIKERRVQFLHEDTTISITTTSSSTRTIHTSTRSRDITFVKENTKILKRPYIEMRTVLFILLEIKTSLNFYAIQ